MWHWCLLWWGVLDEVNALFNVGLETLDGNFKELLLGLGGVLEHVDGVGYTVGLDEQLVTFPNFRDWLVFTPSSMGTEKKSTPVAFWMASPPGTPGR